MVDLSTATQLLAMGAGRLPRPASCHRTLLADGVVHVDYADPDHVFLVTVTQVPRVHLPTGDPVVADLDGVPVRLVDVELANHVTIALAATGPVAEQRLADVGYRLTDDVGTEYRLSTGESGGADHPWRARWQHLPTPPPDARLLRIEFADGRVVAVPLPGR